MISLVFHCIMFFNEQILVISYLSVLLFSMDFKTAFLSHFIPNSTLIVWFFYDFLRFEMASRSVSHCIVLKIEIHHRCQPLRFFCNFYEFRAKITVLLSTVYLLRISDYCRPGTVPLLNIIVIIQTLHCLLKSRKDKRSRDSAY